MSLNHHSRARLLYKNRRLSFWNIFPIDGRAKFLNVDSVGK